MGFCLLVGWFLSSTSCVLMGTSPFLIYLSFCLSKKKKSKQSIISSADLHKLHLLGKVQPLILSW